MKAAEEQVAIKAKTDAQREDPDSLMENLMLKSNKLTVAQIRVFAPFLFL